MHHSDRRVGFEELVRQLLIATPPPDCAWLEHKGPGADGGVEVLTHRTDGRQWGYQTKFFIDGFSAPQVTQLWSSFRSAVASYPAMDRYIVALPVNLSGGVRKGAKSQRQKWEDFRLAAEAEAAAAQRRITIELWGESELLAMLSGHDAIHAGMRLYWFDDLTLTEDWFAERFAASFADLGDRYLPADHVKVSVEAALDVVARGAAFNAAFAVHTSGYEDALRRLERLEGHDDESVRSLDLASLRGAIVEAQTMALSLKAKRLGSIDIRPLEELVKAVQFHPVVDQLRKVEFAPRGEDPSGRFRVTQRLVETFLNPLYSLRSDLIRMGEGLLRDQRLLLIGEAGAGKSHSLGDLTKRHLADGAPAVLMLGQHFLAGDPKVQMLARLDLAGRSFQTFLGAMQAAALAADRPGLIIIDAINESRDPRLWKQNLAGLAVEIAAFDALALIVSCRETYEEACVPAGLAIPRYIHRGFAGDGAAAAKAYLDRNGIDRPAAPFLDAEFTNPLFLSTSVRRLRATGRRAFPPGLDGTAEIFGYWLDGVETNLIDSGFTRIHTGDGRLRKAIARFADELALRRTDELPLALATELFERDVAAFPLTGPQDQLIWRLLQEGVLRRELDNTTGGEAVAFTFQRFSDHFVAEALIRLCGDAAELAVALRPGGFLADLLIDDDWSLRGVVEALMTQTPETFGVELPDLDPTFLDDVRLPLSAFLSSLRWRALPAVTPRTVQLFEEQWESAVPRKPLLDLLFQVCSIPDHGLNGDYLHARLSELPMPERDAMLAGYFADSPEDSPMETLVDWLMEARLDLAERERVRLATMTTAWFLTSSNRSTRDRASRAITSAFLQAPDLMPPLVRAFAEVDDPYVRERVLAATAAAATHLEDDLPALAQTARAVWDVVFDKTVVERHAFTRHYARTLVEIVASRGALPGDIVLERCRPPYASAAITFWPSDDEIGPIVENARAIRSSVLGHRHEDTGRYSMPGDFGKYAMGSIAAEFSAAARSEGDPPRTKGETRHAFWSDLAARDEPIPSLALAALEAHAKREASNQGLVRIYLKHSDTRERAESRSAAKVEEARLDADVEASETALASALSLDHARQTFSYPGHDDDQVKRFSNERARRWVAWRAVDLGWRADLHEAAEQASQHWGGRTEHAIERIGKKYQWIAYHELIGVLADHYWSLPWGASPSILGDILRVESLDIDLSYVSSDEPSRPSGLPRIVIEETDIPPPATLASALAWANAPSDIPHVPGIVEGAGVAGDRWWLVAASQNDRGYLDKLQSAGPMRTGQGTVRMIIVRQTDIDAFHGRLSRHKVNLGDMLDHDHHTDQMFGQYRRGLVQGRPPLDRKFRGTAFGLVEQRFSPFRGEYDLGGGDRGDATFQIPRPWLIDALDLRPAGPRSPWFAAADKGPAFIDPEAFGDRLGASMIKARLLQPTLQSQGLAPAWIYWGEKDGGEGSDEGRGRREFVRATYCGLWWKSGPTWHGSLWRATEDRPHVSYTDDDLEL